MSQLRICSQFLVLGAGSSSGQDSITMGSGGGQNPRPVRNQGRWKMRASMARTLACCPTR